MYPNLYIQNVVAPGNSTAYVIQEQTGDCIEDGVEDDAQDGQTSSENLTDAATPKKQEE